jgi:hypothetical protein
LEAVGINSEANDGLGGLMEAKNKSMLGTKAAAASFPFVVALKAERRLERNAPANEFGGLGGKGRAGFVQRNGDGVGVHGSGAHVGVEHDIEG